MRLKLRSVLADSDDELARGTGEGEEEVTRRRLNEAARPGEAPGENFDGPAEGKGREKARWRNPGEKASEAGERQPTEPDADRPKRGIGESECCQLPGTEVEEADPG